MALIPPRYLDCVVAVGIPNGPDVEWIGSGFLVGKPDALKERPDSEPTYSIWLVSNRHVLNGLRYIVLGFNPEIGDRSKNMACPLVYKGQSMVHCYSSVDNDKVKAATDVAIAPLRWKLLRDEGVKFSCFTLDREAASIAKMKEIQLHEGDSVFVLGYPLGLTTPENDPKGRHYPLVRGGVIARIRDLIDTGKGKFFVDTSNFPGNSGGPVIIKPEIVSIEGLPPQTFPYLIGLVSAYKPHVNQVSTINSAGDGLEPKYLKNDGTLIADKDAGQALVTAENSGLAIVEPIESAIDLITNYPHQEIGYAYQPSDD